MKKRKLTVHFNDGMVGYFHVHKLLWSIMSAKHRREVASFYSVPISVMFEKKILTVEDLSEMLEGWTVIMGFCREGKMIEKVTDKVYEQPDYIDGDLIGFSS